MRGKSGRVVLEVDPAFEHRLHARLASDGLTLKDWFVDCAEAYLQGDESVQLSLPVRLQRCRKEPRGRAWSPSHLSDHVEASEP